MTHSHSPQPSPGAASESGPSSGAAGAPGSRRTADPLVACLVTLCRHHQIAASPAAVRQGLVAADGPMTPDQFVDAAGRFGLIGSIGTLPAAEMVPELLPLVALLDQHRAVLVVARVGEDAVDVIEPTVDDTQRQRWTLDDFNALFTGYVIAVEPDPQRAGQLRPDGITTTAADVARQRWFWGPLLRNWWGYSQVMVAAGMSNLLSLATALFIMVVYDRVLPNEAIDSLLALTIGVVLALLFDFIIKSLRVTFIETVGQRADLEIGRRIFDQMLDLRLKAKKGSTGAYTNVLREFESLREFFTSATIATLVDLPFILFFIFVIYLIGGPLALIPAVAVPAVLILGIALQPFLARLATTAFGDMQTKQSVLVETVSGLEAIKASGAAPLMRKRWEDSLKHHSGVGIRTRRLTQFALNATMFAQQATQVGIVVYGVFLIQDGAISMGAMIAAVILTGRTLAPLSQLAQIMTRFNQARASFRALDRLMEQPVERPPERHFLSRPRLDGKIEFRNVTFSYPDQPVTALNGISFTIEPGEKVAILGRIGSGKSTLGRLALGLYEPDAGAVLIDDTDMRQIDPADLRYNIGSVLQDIWLFSGTVRQNIAVTAPDATDAEILRAASIAGVHDFLRTNPMGYDLVISERGEGLSGGQRQSITLARALVNRPPILLMDEPTSMMDVQTESAVLERLREAAAGCTLLVITHRVSLLDLVDRVIVLDGGRIVADGPKSILSKQARDRAPRPA